MEVPPEVSFRNVEPSPQLKERIHEEIGKLEETCDRIISCRVMVELPHRRHEKGNLYHVRIDLTIPNRELAVSRDPPQDHSREDLNAAITEAFAEMERQLREAC